MCQQGCLWSLSTPIDIWGACSGGSEAMASLHPPSFGRTCQPEPAHSVRTNSSAGGQILTYCMGVNQESLPKSNNKKNIKLYISGERIRITSFFPILEGIPWANLQPVGVSFATKPNESLLRCLARYSSDLNPPPFTRDKKSTSAVVPEALQPPVEQEQLHGHA